MSNTCPSHVLRHVCTHVLTQEFRGVDKELMALARRISSTIPFLPFTKREQIIVADIALRKQLQLYREPAVLDEEPDVNKRRSVGNLHVQHTDEYCEYAAASYDPMEGASSMIRVARDSDGEFVNKLFDGKFDLSDVATRRIRSSATPIREGAAGYCPEPQFWVHHDATSDSVSWSRCRPTPTVRQPMLAAADGPSEAAVPPVSALEPAAVEHPDEDPF